MMSPEQLDSLREKLLEKRSLLLGDVESLADQALHTRDGGRLTEHMADQGTDTYEQEFALNLLQSEEDGIREIDDSLERITAGSYGVCENCSESIPFLRLEAIPYARLCTDCKRQEEEEAG